ncbi:MAG: hypothetical protein GXY77_11270, partial [Fibrobacter sp.]|nr:hypothetical protein [Fibrobacter sp.]
NGKVKFVSGAMLTYGIGAKAGLVFELDVNKAIELFSHIFRSVDWHKVDSVTLMAFEFYTNITFAKFIAAGKLGEYAFDKAKDFWGWFKDKRQHSKDINEFKNNIRVNINNAEELKNSPPETLGHLVLTIMETVESDDFDAIIKILEAAESSHELKWILRNAQDKIKISSDSNDNDKGNALEEGIRRVIEFGLNNDSVSDKLEIYNRKIRTILKRNSIYYE